MASPTKWTWVWVNSGSWLWTGKPGGLQSTGSQRVGHDWATELDWTEVYLPLLCFCFHLHEVYYSVPSLHTCLCVFRAEIILLWAEYGWILFLNLFNVYVGEGNGNPLQYSCLEKTMDGKAWWAAVHGVARSRTRLSDFSFTFHFHTLEKEMATHSSVLAWRIPGTGSLVGCCLWGRTESDTTEVT